MPPAEAPPPPSLLSHAASHHKPMAPLCSEAQGHGTSTICCIHCSNSEAISLPSSRGAWYWAHYSEFRQPVLRAMGSFGARVVLTPLSISIQL